MRGLFSDIANGNAKEGRYIFGNYLIKVTKESGKKSIVNTSKSTSIRYKNLYQKRKEKSICVSCGERPPAKTISGVKSVRCKECLMRQRKEARELKERRRKGKTIIKRVD